MQQDTGINEMWASLLSTYCVPGGARQRGVWWGPAWVETVRFLNPGGSRGQRLGGKEHGLFLTSRETKWLKGEHASGADVVTLLPHPTTPLTCLTLPLKYLGGIDLSPHSSSQAL